LFNEWGRMMDLGSEIDEEKGFDGAQPQETHWLMEE
jgi:hypothetical protein